MAGKRRVWRWVGAALALAILAGAGWAAYVVHAAFEMAAPRHDLQRAAYLRHRDAFLDDQRGLAALPLLSPRAGDEDAGPLLGPRAGWLPGAALERYQASIPAADRKAALPAGLAERLGEGWLDADPSLWQGLDLGWMAGLQRFAYWDLDANAPEGSLGEGDVPPSPTLDLSAWAKLRLAKGLREGDAVRAIREVEELARLCLTTEDVTGVMLAQLLLRHAAEARERAEPGAALQGAEPAVDSELLARLHHAAFGAFALAQLGAPPELDADWGAVRFGRCAALRAKVWEALLVRPALGPSHAAELQRMGSRLAVAQECRLRAVRARWARPDRPEDLARFRGTSWWDRALFLLPAGREWTGEVLLRIAEQDWWRSYERDAEGAPPAPR